jgi:hypothetical protein
MSLGWVYGILPEREVIAIGDKQYNLSYSPQQVDRNLFQVPWEGIGVFFFFNKGVLILVAKVGYKLDFRSKIGDTRNWVI